MCYSLAEALWLHAMGTSDDLLVAYPTVDRQGLRALAANATARQQITIMVDSAAHLDVVDRALGDGHPEIRVCLELDVSWRPLARNPLVHIGTRRSPVHEPRQAAELATVITSRKGFRLAGVMGYEGQIAGLPDAPPGHPVRAQLIRFIQARSVRELSQRRAEAIGMIEAITRLEFVNGGGTGSLESTARDTSVTDSSRAVDSRLPVPPPFTNSRLTRAWIRRAAAVRRWRSSTAERSWMPRISLARTGCPGGASPRPAIWPS